MKKAFKSAAIAALAISAITPVAASAATEDVSNGIYTTEGFYSIADFKKLSTTKKAALLTSPKAALVVNGQALPASIIVTGTDAQIDGSYISLAAYEQQYNVSFNSGTGFGETPQAGELKVESVSAINGTQVEIKFNQAVNTKTGVNSLANFYFSLTEDTVVGSDLLTLNPADYTATFAKDGKSVIITADYSAGKVIWKDNNSSALDAIVIKGSGATADTVVENKTVYVQARDLVLADGKLADTVEGSFVANDKVAPKIAKITSVVNGAATDVTVVFDEPVSDTDAEFYFDSNKVTGAVLDADGQTLTFTESKILADGKYAFEAVGVQDLAGNAPAGDVLSTDLVVATEEAETTIPKVLDIEQAHDGAFYVIFNTAVAAGTEVTIKNLQNNTDETYTLGAVADGTIVEDGKTIGHKYLVHFADLTANVDTANGIYDFADVYKSSTQISRSVIVDKIATGTGVKGKKSTTTETFITDTKAPVVVDSEYNSTTGKFEIQFNDAPFNGSMELDATKSIVVKLIVDGETKSATIPLTGLSLSGTGSDTLSLDLSGVPAFYDNGKIINGDYKFELPRGLVSDDVDDTTPQYSGPYASIASTETIKVTTGTDASVPQTAKGLVKYDTTEKAIYVFFVGKNIDPATATNPANYSVAGKTLTSASKLEYTSSDDLDADFTAIATGLTLPDVPGGFVKIFLEDNTIARDGQYTLDVKNVATKSGAKMLPTSVSVAELVDNTAPVVQSAVIVGDGQLEITFNESVAFEGVPATTSSTDAARNFTVKLGSAAYSVASVEKKTGNDRVLVIHTKDTFGTPNSVTVELKRDQNNDMFVTDAGGNEAVVKSVTASKLQ